MIQFVLGMIVGALFGVASMCVLVVGNRKQGSVREGIYWADKLCNDDENID